MATIEISVTDEDIRLGARGGDFATPLVLAFERACPEATKNNRYEDRIKDNGAAIISKFGYHALPATVQVWNAKWQNAESVQPITFLLEVTSEAEWSY